MLSPDDRIEMLVQLYRPLKRTAYTKHDPLIEAVCFLIEGFLESQGLFGTLRELDKWKEDG